MLTPSRGLTQSELTAIVALQDRVVAHDGGRLKLELGVLAERSGHQVEDLLWWDGDQLVAFLGLYAWGPPDVELAGMVDPVFRRRGIGSALLAAALELATAQGYGRALLVTSPAGKEFGLARSGVHSHSEHFLALKQTSFGTPVDPSVTYRQAVLADVPAIERILEDAFGHPSTDTARRLLTSQESTVVIERDGVVVGTARLHRNDGVGALYGFAVDPARQGQGIGRDVLARFCRQLRDEGFARVTLEVAVDNDHALGLYLSTGFAREATEDYWAIDLGAGAV